MLQRIQLQKGVAVALTSLGKLVQEGLPTELDVAGQGDFLEQARQLSRQLGLERVVRFHGRIPDSDIGPFLSRCHAMLIPDLAQPAFGLVAIEAMHYGLPVIAARSGALPENVHPHCGWVYDDPFDPESLGNLLRQILSHPASLLSRVEHLHSHANRHTASNMARRVSLLYLAMANLDPTGRMERPLQDKAADIP
jgi:glycosyltransferase involved in cell wall biosynthesis